MAESAVRSTVSVVSLKGSNYATWNVQAKMSLMKEGLWRIVDGTKPVPMTPATAVAAYGNSKEKALAILVLLVEPSVFHLIGDTEDPNTVWKNSFAKRCGQISWN